MLMALFSERREKKKKFRGLVLVFGQSELFLRYCRTRSAIPLTSCCEGDGDVGSVPFYFINQPC